MAGQIDAVDGPARSLARAVEEVSARLARAWPKRLAEATGVARPVARGEPAALVAAFVAALDDDLAPLISHLRLDANDADAAAMVASLDDALRRLEALRVAARDVVAADPGNLDAALATLTRQLAVQATATLAFRAAAADERARTGTESLAVTVHELRRPLMVLSSYTQLLNAGALVELDDRLGAASRAMLAATELMLRLVESLNEVSRLEDPSEPSQLEDVEVATVVASAVDQASTEAELREVAIDVDVEPELRMYGDRERLTLALTNLLSNAVKHSRHAGRVRVSAAADSDSIVVRVRDHGRGFSADIAGRLFEKYYRAPDERGSAVAGTGLGLYIVQTVAERHGGIATARPAPGGGAEFELRFPRR